MSQLHPRIYVADLAAYNAGKLHGTWMDADQDPEDIHAQIRDMLDESPVPGAEEWALHDHEDFGGYPLSEYEAVEDVAEFAQLLVTHGAVVAGLASYLGGLDADLLRSYMEDRYQGAWRSLEDYAYDLLHETSQVPEHLEPYLDYAKYARDLELGGDIFTVDADGDTHIFWTR